MRNLLIVPLVLLLASLPAMSQSHQSNWIHRNSMDTTIVVCLNDSSSMFHFPPSSMGMMFPDSAFCQTEIMCLDSLPFPHDSTFLGWCRFLMGSDSMHFNMMNTDTTHGGHHQMGFMRDIQCELQWDSLFCDTTHHGWHLTGIMGWNGSNWTIISNASVTGDRVTFGSSQLYSAFAFIGAPLNPSAIREHDARPGSYALEQNYPNPFNPSTTIQYFIPERAFVEIKVLDVLGQEIATLLNEEKPAGSYTVRWDANGVASGVYLYRLTAGSVEQTRKMLLMR